MKRVLPYLLTAVLILSFAVMPAYAASSVVIPNDVQTETEIIDDTDVPESGDVLSTPTNIQVMPLASDTWTTYGRAGHASASGSTVYFQGHPSDPFVTLLFRAATDGDYRTFTFHLSEGLSDWHTGAATR